jgi:hypothetical protein
MMGRASKCLAPSFTGKAAAILFSVFFAHTGKQTTDSTFLHAQLWLTDEFVLNHTAHCYNSKCCMIPLKTLVKTKIFCGLLVVPTVIELLSSGMSEGHCGPGVCPNHLQSPTSLMPFARKNKTSNK